jgi:hypothetical protein
VRERKQPTYTETTVGGDVETGWANARMAPHQVDTASSLTEPGILLALIQVFARSEGRPLGEAFGTVAEVAIRHVNALPVFSTNVRSQPALVHLHYLTRLHAELLVGVYITE